VSVARAAAKGVAWNMVFGVGARLVQLVGTLVLTRFLAPEAYGAVLAASITVITVGTLTTFAFGQYLIAHRADAKIAFQAATVHIAIGIIAMIPVVVFRARIADLLDTPTMAPFVVGYAAAHLLDRIRYVPDRLVIRALRFRTTATINGAGELLFTAVSLATAPRIGAYAIMTATIVRSVWGCVATLVVAPREEWLAPCPLDRRTVRDLMAYGVPITIAAIADRAATRWDNLIMSKLFGPAVMGRYNLSYSLAEVPISNVAEHIGEVLMPAFSRMEEEERRTASVRAAGLMSLVVSPLGVGLGAVAPTLVATFFDARWAQMSSMLMILSVMTVFRPITWSAVAYLQAVKQTRVVMFLCVGRAVVVLSLLALFGMLFGEIGAVVGATIAMAIHSVTTIVVGGRVTGFATKTYFWAALRPLLACIPMFFAVVALRGALDALGTPKAVALALEIILGGIVYAVSAFVLAPDVAKQFLRLAREAVSRRR
jgi:lipopolysaccharide exporter